MGSKRKKDARKRHRLRVMAEESWRILSEPEAYRWTNVELRIGDLTIDARDVVYTPK